MTVISVGLGRLLHVADEALPFHSEVPWDDYAAVALLLFFGVRTLQDASEPKAEEEQADAEVAVAGMKVDGAAALLLSTFLLVFAAEWGDKSFLATIALAAASDPAGVVAGAVVGHGTATAIAVAGGSLLGEYVSEKVVAYVGGSLFIVFAAVTAVDIALGNR
jgi:putative Ca2+/H+ antiporter (TMEM165/GDT1 family)